MAPKGLRLESCHRNLISRTATRVKLVSFQAIPIVSPFPPSHSSLIFDRRPAARIPPSTSAIHLVAICSHHQTKPTNVHDHRPRGC